MNYGYIQVSSNKQTVENQRFEIEKFCKRNGVVINFWIEETISSTKDIEQRKLGTLLKKIKKDIQALTIIDNYRLDSDISSKVLAFAFGLSAEIERNLISQRTKEALARKKAEGVILGRPKGSKSKVKKLTGKEAEIRVLLDKKVSKSAIARILGVHRLTVTEFVKLNNLL